jgi:hypothetical protein
MLIHDDSIRDFQSRVPLTMNLGLYLGPINRDEDLECIGKPRVELKKKFIIGAPTIQTRATTQQRYQLNTCTIILWSSPPGPKYRTPS